jgi:hypothetical protein
MYKTKFIPIYNKFRLLIPTVVIISTDRCRLKFSCCGHVYDSLKINITLLNGPLDITIKLRCKHRNSLPTTRVTICKQRSWQGFVRNQRLGKLEPLLTFSRAYD